MARASVTTQIISRSGLNPSLTAATADGDIVDSGQVFLDVNNGSGGSINVTVESPVTYDGLELSDLIVAVPAGQRRLIGPFPARTFQQPDGATVGAKRVLVNYSAITSVTRAVISF